MKPANRALTCALAIGLVTAAANAQSKPSPPRHSNSFGTAADSVYHVPVSEFTSRDSENLYSDFGDLNGTISRYPTNCVGLCLVAIPHLPDGALLTGILIYFCDSNPTYDVGVEIYNANYDGTFPTRLAGVDSTGQNSGCGGFQFLDLTPLNYQVNYQNNQLVLFGKFGTNDPALSLSGANIYYRLQVSPAPLTATFNDVPTSDFGFQFVEAFAAAGITVGCTSDPPFNPPVFCPDRNVTRREMAIFFAKALGLQFP